MRRYVKNAIRSEVTFMRVSFIRIKIEPLLCSDTGRIRGALNLVCFITSALQARDCEVGGNLLLELRHVRDCAGYEEAARSVRLRASQILRAFIRDVEYRIGDHQH